MTLILEMLGILVLGAFTLTMWKNTGKLLLSSDILETTQNAIDWFFLSLSFTTLLVALILLTALFVIASQKVWTRLEKRLVR